MIKAIFKVFIFSFIFSFVTILLSSCDTSDRKPIDYKRGETVGTSLITLTVNGESHEFVNYCRGKYNNGIAHWPSCKYCKKDSIN